MHRKILVLTEFYYGFNIGPALATFAGGRNPCSKDHKNIPNIPASVC